MPALALVLEPLGTLRGFRVWRSVEADERIRCRGTDIGYNERMRGTGYNERIRCRGTGDKFKGSGVQEIGLGFGVRVGDDTLISPSVISNSSPSSIATTPKLSTTLQLGFRVQGLGFSLGFRVHRHQT